MKRGFTLAEMLVVITLVSLITSVVLANTRSLNTNALVKASAGTIIDTAKDARTKAVSVEQFTTSVFPSYGIHFDMSAPTKITIYADCLTDDDGSGTVDEGDTFHFARGSTVSQCVGQPDGFYADIALARNTEIKSIKATYPITGTMTTMNQSKIDIQFLRPEPTIWMVDASENLIPVGFIDVTVGDKGNKFFATVRFYSTGQFYVL